VNLTFLYLSAFAREWDRQRLTDEDLPALEALLATKGGSAPVMRGTGGMRKIRFAPLSWHTGKSGAARIGFAFFRLKSVVVVVAMFAKNETGNFTGSERASIAGKLARIERALK
jgi:hypothetical protein